MINWINNRFGTNFKEAEIESIKDFSLIWNIFERYVCNNNFTIDRAENEISVKKIDIAKFQTHLDYFKSRYTENGNVNHRFAHLNFRANDRQQLVNDVLLGGVAKPNQVILALVIIVYRYRNNLFHGIKDIQLIDQQNENFEIANSFLTTLLDYF
ncbi:hypothetical protein SNE26_23950 [Mucilaginibacter sp. cycad4]|uniref:hypothetical protein n=1 Tax=Mucilaginibacter sp. cycad4 TaxID=3342096 RepID=UPI002AAB40A8|nr:hypothetical protein [Mucilaginibacter gossypii]WPU99070.1 hypothetical protein SNE26_23950 [Mucilaginibacter gossypii]